MRGKGKGEFIAHQGEISEKLQQGWPIKMAWQHFKDAGTVNIGYHAFARYVNNILGYRPYKTTHGMDNAPGVSQPLRAAPALTNEQITTNNQPVVKTSAGKTAPKFSEPEKPTAPAEKEPRTKGDGPVMVSTFNKQKPIRPGNRGMALNEDDLI